MGIWDVGMPDALTMPMLWVLLTWHVPGIMLTLHIKLSSKNPNISGLFLLLCTCRIGFLSCLHDLASYVWFPGTAGISVPDGSADSAKKRTPAATDDRFLPTALDRSCACYLHISPSLQYHCAIHCKQHPPFFDIPPTSESSHFLNGFAITQHPWEQPNVHCSRDSYSPCPGCTNKPLPQSAGWQWSTERNGEQLMSGAKIGNHLVYY